MFLVGEPSVPVLPGGVSRGIAFSGRAFPTCEPDEKLTGEYGEVGTIDATHPFRRVIDQVVAEHTARNDNPLTLAEWEEWTPTGALDLDVVVRSVQEER